MKYIILLIIPFIVFASDDDKLSFIEKYLNDAKIDKVLHKDTFTIFYSYKYKQPICTISYLTSENVKIKSDRKKLCKFKEDLSIPKEYRSTLDDYRGSGFDRGHCASFASSDYTIQGAKDSCLLSNISPQYGSHFNRSVWKEIESSTRELTEDKNITVITVVFFDNNPWNNKFLEVGQKLQVPDGFAKIILQNEKVIKFWFIEHKNY